MSPITERDVFKIQELCYYFVNRSYQGHQPQSQYNYS
jgi:hypothetical protein